MPKIHNKTTPFTDALHVFELHCRVQRFRPTTLKTYHYILSPFAEWLAAEYGIRTLQEVAPAHVRAYMVYKGDGGAAAEYLHTIGRTLRAFFNFAVADELIEASPMRNVPMPRKPKKILSAMTAKDIGKLLAAADSERDRTIVLFLLDTGVRASECCNLTVGDLDLREGSAAIIAGKGEKDRRVYYGAKTARALLKHIGGKASPREPLFCSEKTGKPLTRHGMFQLLRRLARLANVNDCSPHAMRRTFAINSLRNGMNIFVLARLMGHSDITILRQYLQLVDDDSQAAVQRYGVVDNL